MNNHRKKRSEALKALKLSTILVLIVEVFIVVAKCAGQINLEWVHVILMPMYLMGSTWGITMLLGIIMFHTTKPHADEE